MGENETVRFNLLFYRDQTNINLYYILGFNRLYVLRNVLSRIMKLHEGRLFSNATSHSYYTG